MTRVLRPGGRLVILEITPSPARAARRLLLALVRPAGAGARHARRRSRRLQLPARLGADIPRAGEARRDDRRRGPRPRSAGCCSPAGSSPSTARTRSRHDPLLGTTPGDRRDGRRERLAARAHGGGRGQARRAGRRLRAEARRGGRGDAQSGRQAPSTDPGADGAGDGAGERAIRAATAVELLHMATLVHDDVLDGAPVRRGRPTVVPARAGTAPSGSGTCSSRAPSRSWPPDGGDEEVAELSSASVALALGELAQRSDAYDTSIGEERYLERCSLKTARLFESACRVGRLAAGGAGTEEPGAASAARSGSPSSCSTTCSTSPGLPSGPARRAARTCSTAP